MIGGYRGSLLDGHARGGLLCGRSGAEYQRTTDGPVVRHSDAALRSISLRVDELPSGACLPERDGSSPRYPSRWATAEGWSIVGALPVWTGLAPEVATTVIDPVWFLLSWCNTPESTEIQSEKARVSGAGGILPGGLCGP
ncbi:hypothetical protein NDU88_004846 [Pleurodeles waltl]|uniref:Uncharacterized protein n=1 Tax=Pleurodeles waltl TaxID=8319 RepID=A0AAV7PHW7_PLEWA|nr:hypothetical protein NDU88_004846 [Pleurodeles waltl]